MEWLAPFGKDFLNPDFAPGDSKKLWGTPSFPSIRLSEDDVPKLPKQGSDDGWNCGFGLVATIAIVMRDIIGSNDESRNLYCNEFQMATFETEGCSLDKTECVFYLPKGFFQPLPSPGEGMWIHGNYLSTLRVEWFGIFDSLAELQNNVIPFRVDSRFKQGIDYIRTKNDRKFPDWLNQGPKETAQGCLIHESVGVAESMVKMSEATVVTQTQDSPSNIAKTMTTVTNLNETCTRDHEAMDQTNTDVTVAAGISSSVTDVAEADETTLDVANKSTTDIATATRALTNV